MLSLDPVLSIIFILGPVIFLFIFLGLIIKLNRKTFLWNLFIRVLAGYTVFWVLYILFPAFLNLINPLQNAYQSLPLYVTYGTSSYSSGMWVTDINNFLRYTGQLYADSIVLFLFYPFTLFPVIFIMGPLISFLILWRELRKVEKGSFFEKIRTIQFEIETSPSENIKNRLTKNDWTNEKQLLKILLAVLPISLYLLMTFMKVVGYQEQANILAGTSLGWFLEIFFVYLATGMFSIHLLYSGRISYKGDYIGFKVRNTMIQSLTTVGFFVSAIAIILFLVEYSTQIFVVLYFICYFLMVSLLFILFLDIFEPISIFVLMKVIEVAKNYGPKPAVITEVETFPFRKIEHEDIYVPPVNIDELKAGPIYPTTPVETVVAHLLEEKLPEKSIQEPSVQPSSELPNTYANLHNKVLKDSLKVITAIITSIVLLIIINGILYYLLVAIPSPISSTFSSIKNNISIQPLIFYVIYFLYGLGILIPLRIFISRKLLVPALLGITVNILLSAVDYVLRRFIGYFNGITKFSAIPYELFYYTFISIIFVVVLSGSILLLKRYQWDVIPNISILVITGFLMGFVWLVFYQIIPDTNIQFSIANYNLILYNLTTLTSNNQFLVPIATFNPTVQAFIPWIYAQPGTGSEEWITTIFQPIFLANNAVFLTPFLVQVPVNFALVLGIISLPFRFVHDISNIALFGLLFFFLQKEFITVIAQIDNKGSLMEKSIFSVRDTVPTVNEVLKDPEKYAIIRNFGLEPLVDDTGKPTNRELSPLENAIYNIELGEKGQLGPIIMEFTGETPITFKDLSIQMQTDLALILAFFQFVSKTYLSREEPFTIIRREYGYDYEEAKLDSLHVMMTDGRSVYTHSFTEESRIEPALIAGLFSAITSFAKEAVKAEKLLRTIDHGDIILQIEYGRYVFAALICDRNSIEFRSKLVKFLNEFESQHQTELENWLGDTSLFVNDYKLVNEIFGE